MTDLIVSEVSVEPIVNKAGHLGFVSFVINNNFRICNVAIHSSPSSPFGIRLVFPQKEYKGVRLNTVYPINQTTYQVVLVAVAEAYEELMEKIR
ncbi:MAG: hypothetical protein P9L90_05430 [Candidatus Aadella gelida]|nr:hypothetical protein [Candidatus Aadella gelida]